MKFMVVAVPFAVLMDIIVFFNFWQWHQESIYEFEQRQLDLQVNYSIDAAIHDMLKEGTHIDTDYDTWGKMTTEPEVALNTYVAVLLRNRGWADSYENRQNLIESSIPFFCVACYDGYYMYCRQRDIYEYKNYSNNTIIAEASSYPMKWTPKLPYTATVITEDESGKSATCYMYDMGFKYYNRINPDGTTSLKQSIPQIPTRISNPSIMAAKNAINETLTEACNTALYLGLEADTNQSWYLPATFSSWSDNRPVETPTILTYVSNSDKNTKYNTVTFGIGGAKIDQATFVICYTLAPDEDNVMKFYTYAYNRDKVLKKYDDTINEDGTINGQSNFSGIEKVYSTAREAAENGYYYDTEF